MKRRLDLALALLHNPRILFLDEPTTGLDVQSRTALWDEVERLAREEGTTVFLTTQYLEEADVLADRVGIIDRGKIVAEGTPAQLKAQVAKPTVEVIPRDADECAAAERALEPFGDARRAARRRLDRRAAGLRRRAARRHRPRAGPGERRRRQPRAARADARRRLPRQDRPQPRGRPADAGRPDAASREPAGGVTALAHSAMPAQVGLLAGRAIKRILRNPAQMVFPILFPLILLAVNASGLDAATNLPGFPTDSYLDFALAIPFMQGALFAALNGGQDLARDIEGGFLDRLAMTPLSGAALLAGQLGGALFMGLISAVLYLVVGVAFGVGIATGVGGALVLLAARAGDLVGVRLLRHVRRAARRHRRGRAGLLSALLRPAVPQLGVLSARPHRAGLVSHDRDVQPRLLHGRGHPQPRDRRLGRAGARAGVRDRRRSRSSPSSRSARGPCGRGWCGHEHARPHPLGRARRRLAQHPQRVSRTRRSCCRASCSRCSSSSRSRAGCRACRTRRTSTTSPATRRFSSRSSASSRRRSAASSRALRSPPTSSSASPAGCCSRRPTAAGSSPAT